MLNEINASTVLSAVVRTATVSPSVAAVAAELGRNAVELAGPIDQLERDGWITRWDNCPDGPAISLTPLGAARLKLALSGDSQRWVSHDAKPTLAKLRCGRRIVAESDLTPAGESDSEHFARIDQRVDARQFEPVDDLIGQEAVERELRQGTFRGDRGADRLPFPTRLIGSTIPWDGPEITLVRRVCRTCGGQPLKGNVYCLKCDNWGLQKRIPIEAPRVSTRRRVRADSLKGGIGA
jgi:hypothetical protein